MTDMATVTGRAKCNGGAGAAAAPADTSRSDLLTVEEPLEIRVCQRRRGCGGT